MTNKLFIGRLSHEVTSIQLNDHFATVGSVVSARVIVDFSSGKSKGFGFVEMNTPELAEEAIKVLNGSQLSGMAIVVRQEQPSQQRQQNNKGFGGGPSKPSHRRKWGVVV